MTSTGPTLNITYDELLDEIKGILRVLCRHNSNPKDYASPTDAYDRGCRYGAIALWYSLALSMRTPGRDCEEDRRQLELMAGLTRENQEPSADGR
ncbi:hypothetical protein A3N57_07670 [Enterobacter cloacae subsp. dissolvens]|uniref:hypothetical protein n=1 Tax=Enterobacter cloacae TaxID=550 RepID=UPI0007B34028|nr:hypothetical protein [Enterobacter cloacae]KZQ40633.1 hypothetical protein A3N57_07670 [Enterobacter cloacae subsp. dissolvens]